MAALAAEGDRDRVAGRAGQGQGVRAVLAHERELEAGVAPVVLRRATRPARDRALVVRQPEVHDGARFAVDIEEDGEGGGAVLKLTEAGKVDGEAPALGGGDVGGGLVQRVEGEEGGRRDAEERLRRGRGEPRLVARAAREQRHGEQRERNDGERLERSPPIGFHGPGARYWRSLPGAARGR